MVQQNGQCPTATGHRWVQPTTSGRPTECVGVEVKVFCQDQKQPEGLWYPVVDIGPALARLEAVEETPNLLPVLQDFVRVARGLEIAPLLLPQTRILPHECNLQSVAHGPFDAAVR